MTRILIISVLSTLLCSCSSSQSLSENNFRLVGGPCEGCEAIFEYGEKVLRPVDTLPDFNKQGLKIKVTGTIYQNDGNTPAKDVILYVYHTNQEGIYETKENSKGWEEQHGYIRGWVKTDETGRYAFYTLKPGIYPNRSSQPTFIRPSWSLMVNIIGLEAIALKVIHY